jgi:hypothetical protein
MNTIFRPKRLTSYDDESIINEIKRVLSKHFGNKVPSMKDFNRYSMVSSYTIAEHFGGWRNAIKKAGFKYVKYEETESFLVSEMIKDLKRIRDLSGGKYFTQDFYKNKGKYSIKRLKKYLGSSWQDILTKTLSLKKPVGAIRIIKPKRKSFTEDDLFVEMKKVWEKLGRRPSYREFRENSNIGMKVYERRFGSWKKAVERFCLKFNYDIKGLVGNEATPELLLHELKTIGSKIPEKIFTFKKYRELGGGYSIGTFQYHFKKWRNAVESIGKNDGHSVGRCVKRKYSDQQYFSELQRIWEALGRQPEIREMKLMNSKMSGDAFCKRFGSWTKAIHAFCLDRNTNKEDIKNKNIGVIYPDMQLENKALDSQQLIPEEKVVSDYIVKTTYRTSSLRLRFQIMQRDNFKCVKCGRSPANEPGIVLHIDHKDPYSKKGETTLDNLQTLCKDCNLGKGDL